jgi:thymidylate synthase
VGQYSISADRATYYGAYGFRLRQHFGLDQLLRAYLALSANRESRQIVLQFWDCKMDLPTDQGHPRAEDIPCNVMSILKLREGRLEWTQIMRSNDLVLGLPHNIVQFTCLQEVMAGWLGVQLGEFNHYADSLHIYDRDEPIADRIDYCSLPQNNESIALPKEASDRSFVSLGRFADVLTSSGKVADLLTTFDELDVDPSFRSWAAVLIADALRRRDAHREMEAVMNGCSNPCLAMLFERWLQRKSTR